MIRNSQLSKLIQEHLTQNPNLDQNGLSEKVCESATTLRMKKQSIKAGVKDYFKHNNTNNKAKDQKVQEKSNNNESYGLDQFKKKVKRNNQNSEFDPQFVDKPEYQFENLGGIANTLAQLNFYLLNPLKSSVQPQYLLKNFILSGPIGCGKTFLSYCILSHLKKQYNFNAWNVNINTLLGSSSNNDAEQKIKKLFQEAIQRQPSVILFDQLDLFFQKDIAKRPQGTPLPCFLNEIDKLKQHKVYLIATSSNPEKLDIQLKKLNRFEKIIGLDISADHSRCEILEKLLMKVDNNISSEQVVSISKITSGYMPADLEVLIKESIIQRINQSSIEQTPKISYQNILSSLSLIKPLLIKEGFTQIPQTTLSDIGGLDELKQQLIKEIIVPIQKQSKFKEINFSVENGGVLLYGPPGCGKTMLAKAIANAVRANFIIVKGPEVLNKYVGQSEQAVREIFGRAQRASPCIIFFDQFDAIAPKRSDQGNQVTQRIVNTLLTALDGVQQRKMVFIVAATNRKDMLDDAVLRSGRIQKHLYVPQPNERDRVDIIKAITKTIVIQPNSNQNSDLKETQLISVDQCFHKMAKQTEGYSGADLRYIIKQAVVEAVTNQRKHVTVGDLLKSLQAFLSSRKKDDMQSNKLKNMSNKQLRYLQSKLESSGLVDHDEEYEFKMKKQQQNDGNAQLEVIRTQNKNVQKNKPILSANILQEFMEFMISKSINKTNQN